MAEAKKKLSENKELSYELEGLEQIFEQPSPHGDNHVSEDTKSGAHAGTPYVQVQVERLVERLTDLISLSIDQRVETGKITAQLIENQRQLVATQQILIRLMERSIELTRHISSIEERLPAIFELPRLVESLRQRVAQLEGIEF